LGRILGPPCGDTLAQKTERKAMSYKKLWRVEFDREELEFECECGMVSFDTCSSSYRVSLDQLEELADDLRSIAQEMNKE
jgi:hypothetical protein